MTLAEVLDSVKGDWQTRPASGRDTRLVEATDIPSASAGAPVVRGNRAVPERHRISSDDAVIIAQTLDPRVTKDPAHRAYHRRNLARGRMAGQIRLRVRFRTYIGPWFDYLFVTRDEMNSIVAGTGWRVREFVDGDGPCYVAILDKDPAGRPSRRSSPTRSSRAR